MRKGLTIALAFAVLGSFSFTPASAAIKPGASCTKFNQFLVVAGYKFTCVKSGAKGIWSKGVKISAPKVIPPTSPSPVPSPTSTVASDTDVINSTNTSDSDFLPTTQCEINAENPNDSFFDLGFHRSALWGSTTGTRNIVVLYLSYQDAQLNASARDEYQNTQETEAENFYKTSSYGKFDLSFTNSTKTYLIDKSTDSYALKSTNPQYSLLFHDAIAAVGSDFDFSKFQEVVLVVPDEIVATDIGPTYGYGAIDSSNKINLGIFGTYRYPTGKRVIHTGWLTHEIGHTLGLSHPYFSSNGYGIWDLMGYDNTYAPDLFTWEKFVLGWINPQQVYCLDTNLTNEKTVRLEENGLTSSNKKMLIVRTSDTQALVVESRRKDALDNIQPGDEGVIVYKLDLNLGFDKGIVTLVGNSQKSVSFEFQNLYSSSLHQGESLIVDGLRISVKASDSTGDTISISKNI